MPAGAAVNPKDGAVMVLVPEGPFRMGGDSGEENEQPAHRIHLDRFWIYQREVTNEQFLRFVEETGYEPEGDWRAYATEAGRLNHPVINVTWNDAVAYYAVNMIGNVWEWCSDWYDPFYYRRSTGANPTGPEKTDKRVVRGGGFDFNLRGFPRCAMRTSGAPKEADPARGFRVVISRP